MPRSMHRVVTSAIVLGLILSAAGAHAQIFVKHDAVGLNDGSSWINAYVDLQDALAAAVATDEIWVAAGVYYPDSSDSTVSFDIPNSVELYGGFDGTEMSLGERDWTLNVTTLSGEIGSPDSTDNSYNVVTCTGGGSDTVLDGFTVTGGVSNPVSREGGGMRIDGSDVIVANVLFTGNSSLQFGGGIYLNGGSPTFTSVDFVSNSAGSMEGATTYPGYGGGVYAINASPTFDGCNFNDNVLPFPGEGGGIRAVGTGTATFTDCTFDGNDRDGISSGDVVVSGSTFTNNVRRGLTATAGTVTDCTAAYNGSGGVSIQSGTITGCTAEYNSGSGFAIDDGTMDQCQSRHNSATQGAGVYVGGDATITDCEFIDNTATSGGGGANVGGLSSPSFVKCLFLDNTTGGSGGGIYAGFGSGTSVTNSLFMGNSATFTGGGWQSVEGCNGRVTNVTFYDNSAGDTGGAIAVTFGCPEFYNTVVWNNGFTPVAFDIGGTATFHSSLIEGSGGSSAWDNLFGIDGGGNIDADPEFIDEGGADLRLAIDSPAVDAGDDAAPNLSSPDLGGNPRISGAAVDMGAWEFHCPTGPLLYVDADATGASTGDSWADALPTLREALSLACTTVTEIWVAEGTYTPTAGDNRNRAFHLRDGVSVYGGFAGGEANLSERDIAANKTTLSGEIAAAGPSDNSFHVLVGSGTDTSAVLDGVTVEHGEATGAYPDDRGGGMLTVQGNPTVRNVVFANNRGFNGGAVANLFADIELTNVVFYSNAALSNSGGALHNTLSSPALTNVTAHGNTALATGGGMYNSSSNPVLVNVILWGNSNGEISNTTSSPQISHSLIQGSGGSSSWSAAFGTDGGGNIDDDPLFVSAGAGNLRLDSGSPAIDAGDGTAPNLLAIDLDGNNRVAGAAVDMGAYEADVTSAADDAPPVRATAFRSVHPNPFNPSVTIEFDLERAGQVNVSVYDVRGRLVRRLIGARLPAGLSHTRWDGRNGQGQRVASGIYILRLDAAGVSDQRKLVLLK